ncbi:MAG TPA: terminase family protein [Casimicrobiaceae bacterium]|nr:terminase family protein [Casimicrobiaceae bacterium]
MIPEPFADYLAHDGQARFHASGKRFLCAAAGARGGKTKAAAVEFIRRVANDVLSGKGNKVAGIGRKRRPRLHYWVVAPTEALLSEPLRYLFEGLPPSLIQGYFATDNSLWLVGDVLIEFKSADNPLHLVSTGLHGIWIDEAARVKADAWLGQLRQRLSDHKGWALFSTTPLGRNWLYDEIVLKSGLDPEYETIKWTTAHNPIIPREEIAAAKRQLPKRYFEREYEASFDAFIGNVFDEWSEATHIVSEVQLAREYGLSAYNPIRSILKNVVAGVDWGWNSPGAIVVVGQLGNQYLVLDESYAANRILSDSRLDHTWVTEARRLRNKWGIGMFYCDPESPEHRETFARFGLPVRTADNDLVFGVRKCAELMHPIDGRPRLRVLDTCKNLIREIRNYQWAQNKKVDGFSDLPAPDQSDHAIDAMRYALMESSRYESGEPDNRYREKCGPRF